MDNYKYSTKIYTAEVFKIFSLIQCLCFLLQVFATYPNEDYDRRNEDVDPMAASAEYELEKRVERLDLFPVELEKGTKNYKIKLGFGHTNNSMHLFQPTSGIR